MAKALTRADDDVEALWPLRETRVTSRISYGFEVRPGSWQQPPLAFARSPRGGLTTGGAGRPPRFVYAT